MEPGNHVTDSSFMRAMKTFEKYLSYTTKVAEIARVTGVSNDTITCQLLSDDSVKLSCIAVKDLEVEAKDIVVVLFTDTDFRSNLKRIKAESDTQNVQASSTRHAYAYGVIIAKI